MSVKSVLTPGDLAFMVIVAIGLAVVVVGLATLTYRCVISLIERAPRREHVDPDRDDHAVITSRRYTYARRPGADMHADTD